jgi:hypothetical protein
MAKHADTPQLFPISVLSLRKKGVEFCSDELPKLNVTNYRKDGFKQHIVMSPDFAIDYLNHVTFDAISKNNKLKGH